MLPSFVPSPDMLDATIIYRIFDNLLNVLVIRIRSLLLAGYILDVLPIENVSNPVYIELPVAAYFVNVDVLCGLLQ